MAAKAKIEIDPHSASASTATAMSPIALTSQPTTSSPFAIAGAIATTTPLLSLPNYKCSYACAGSWASSNGQNFKAHDKV